MKVKNNQKLFKALKKVINLKRIIILIVLLAGNSFAWFIYSQQVEGNVNVHVRSWKVVLESANQPITTTYDVKIDNMYPGMSDFSQSIQVYNKSEMSADITYTILEMNILGTNTITKEGVLEQSGTLSGTEITSSDLVTKLNSDYPFKIAFTITNSIVDADTGESNFTINVTWPFESGNDALDTEWGNNAYVYKTNNPSSPSITMKVKLSVAQHVDN